MLSVEKFLGVIAGFKNSALVALHTNAKDVVKSSGFLGPRFSNSALLSATLTVEKVRHIKHQPTLKDELPTLSEPDTTVLIAKS